jgi:hypothetical protein
MSVVIGWSAGSGLRLTELLARTMKGLYHILCNTVFTFALSSTVVVICTVRFNIEILYILSTQCVYPFRMVLRINTDYFPKHH